MMRTIILQGNIHYEHVVENITHTRLHGKCAECFNMFSSQKYLFYIPYNCTKSKGASLLELQYPPSLTCTVGSKVLRKPPP